MLECERCTIYKPFVKAADIGPDPDLPLSATSGVLRSKPPVALS
ncbi:hypothetical protein PAMC26510_16515 [Caballeronia sordidicola]|uniref:Uncharacterized protein n=1 Tax=Caballeronia sordidicola TaxID=196367 RepID=A0A242MSU3_CABSO|nr:hypothetical protein PAMC26510_16515 [Caballeronia sordidicola]